MSKKRKSAAHTADIALWLGAAGLVVGYLLICILVDKGVISWRDFIDA